MSSSPSSPSKTTRPVLSGRFARPLVVLPTYNEIDTLAFMLAHVPAAVPDASVLVVDDNSPDGTGKWAEEHRRDDPRLFIAHRPRKLGLGSAYKLGFAWGLNHGFGVLVEMDADASHNPMELPSLLAALQAGADLAIGSRYVDGGSTPGWSRDRRVLSTTSNAFARRLLGLPVRDATSGYRAYRAEILERIDIEHVASDGYAFQVETLWRVLRAGGKVVEVPIEFHDRMLGSSKISRAEVFQAAATLLRLRHQHWIPPTVPIHPRCPQVSV